ncbi:hypothetical protein [Alteromonas sp. C1M14]|uniref:ATP-grasp domain-containing protein n=1 Tax=Alteromonas sp. C1M14 TaxID=2841567 RepID=UPI001C08B001|nr:hypothetical protein [Alteromonas sp. C1M14]MBU2977290.1 hypothetical protein [Alteromonas sp. C1M14]
MLALCLGDAADPQIQHIANALATSKVDVCIVNTAHFPSNIHIHFAPKDNHYLIAQQNEQYPLEAFGVFYWQRFVPPIQSTNSSLLANLTSALSPLFLTCPHRWYNSLHAVRYHQAKPMQLSAAHKLGALIPATCISNHIHHVTSFCRTQPNLIVKPVFGGTYTQRIKRNGKLSTPISALLTGPPLTFQAWVEGEDIRSFVIDDQVFSAEISSDADDYRIDTCASAHKTNLPKNIEDLSIRLCREMGMKWCAIDWRRTSNNRYVFLEANPCPTFCRFESDTGLPITEALIGAMIKTAVT